MQYGSTKKIFLLIFIEKSAPFTRTSHDGDNRNSFAACRRAASLLLFALSVGAPVVVNGCRH
jgi:hypothetical protein